MDFIIKRFPQVNTCCLCCSTEKGAKIIGWLEFVGSILYCASIIAGLAYAATKQNNEKHQTLTAIMWAWGASHFLLCVCHIVLAVLLLLGVYRQQLDKVWLWLQVYVTLYVLNICFLLVILIACCATDAKLEKIVTAAVQLVLTTIIEGYILAVVKSYYVSIGGEFK